MLNKSTQFFACVLALTIAWFGGTAMAAEPENDAPHVVFMVTEDPHNYEAHATIPPFAETLRGEQGLRVTVIEGEGEPEAFRFPGLEDALPEADLLVVFFRRRALSEEQMGLIKGYLEDGNPLVGIRTANHAFSLRDDAAEGYEDWWDFVPDILGCGNHGYGPVELGTQVRLAPGAEGHPILEDFEPPTWHSQGNAYFVAPLADNAEVLLIGDVMEDSEPIAWTRETEYGGRVFYTSLGYPSDFGVPQFRALLTNGIRWALGEDG